MTDEWRTATVGFVASEIDRVTGVYRFEIVLTPSEIDAVPSELLDAVSWSVDRLNDWLIGRRAASAGLVR